MKVVFRRLLEMLDIVPDEAWEWDNIENPIKLDEVVQAYNNGATGCNEPYGDTFKHPVKRERDREYHIKRILYFVQHPEEISAIEVDNDCKSDYGIAICPKCVIVDGRHRMAAAIILQPDTIEISYGGRVDIEDYLTGKSDEKPEEIMFF